MAIEFKSPSEIEQAAMKKFGEIIDSAFQIIAVPEMQHVAQYVAKNLQEALFWFTHGILNKPVVQAVEEIASVAADIAETVIENPEVEKSVDSGTSS